MGTMAAAVMTGVGEIDIQHLPIPELGPREFLVKIGAASICSWGAR